jgi:hypothetical protein
MTRNAKKSTVLSTNLGMGKRMRVTSRNINRIYIFMSLRFLVVIVLLLGNVSYKLVGTDKVREIISNNALVSQHTLQRTSIRILKGTIYVSLFLSRRCSYFSGNRSIHSEVVVVVDFFVVLKD